MIIMLECQITGLALSLVISCGESRWLIWKSKPIAHDCSDAPVLWHTFFCVLLDLTWFAFSVPSSISFSLSPVSFWGFPPCIIVWKHSHRLNDTLFVRICHESHRRKMQNFMENRNVLNFYCGSGIENWNISKWSKAL